MTMYESALSDLATRLTGTDASLTTSLRDIVAAALQELIEAELTATIGAAPGERHPDRVTQRNGHRPKLVSTPAGDVEVGIPKLRQGSFFPELLGPRRRIDKALWAVIMTAYITGTSTRKVDDLASIHRSVSVSERFDVGVGPIGRRGLSDDWCNWSGGACCLLGS